MTNRNEPFSPFDADDKPGPHQPTLSSELPQVTLRSPAELADALPYLLGFHPTDSVVMLALQGERGRFGGRLRLGLPATTQDWPETCDQLADCLITDSRRRGVQVTGVILFLCQDPHRGEEGQQVMERLRPLAQQLRVACGKLDAPVLEALCISDGTFWSYCCPDPRCCSPEGTPLILPGTSRMAAAATYAGIQVRGSLRQMEARLAPLSVSRAPEQEQALDQAASNLVPAMLGSSATAVRSRTLDLAERVLGRFGQAAPVAGRSAADDRDDALLAQSEAAEIILGLQDRVTRDQAAEWMEGPQAEPALRMWRALARRCVGVYGEHAAAPLALAGWVAWSLGDEPEAKVALSRALHADPDYVFAKLLHQACNEGIDPEPLRQSLRVERARRSADGALRAAVQGELCRLDEKTTKVVRQRSARSTVSCTGRQEPAQQSPQPTSETGNGTEVAEAQRGAAAPDRAGDGPGGDASALSSLGASGPTGSLPLVPRQRRRGTEARPSRGSRPASGRGAGESRGPGGRHRMPRRGGPRDANGRS
ncbi:DUF4192 family protein [Streptomyces sp. HSW2009]|uniref:DUF4192 domain-containing protein n=1 Tax=Streptomyces sp. HSW2009 TaxID=3142890 RepID=UPI0032EDAAA3